MLLDCVGGETAWRTPTPAPQTKSNLQRDHSVQGRAHADDKNQPWSSGRLLADGCLKLRSSGASVKKTQDLVKRTEENSGEPGPKPRPSRVTVAV